MPARIINGKAAAAALLSEMMSDVAGLSPKLVIIQVGDNADSTRYIRAKLKACTENGIAAEHKHLPAATTFDALEKVIHALNDDAAVTGMIVQLPLPEHLQDMQPRILRAIEPKKDVDGLTAYNLGKLMVSKEFEHLPPATAAGVLKLLEYEQIPVAGTHVVIVGRSTLVGKPLAMMLLHRDATVTVCHSKTADLAALTRQADILIAAAGAPGLITTNMVKSGAVVVDVGFTDTDDGVRGDVDPDVANVASALTPVPGGVGPMTVAQLLANVVTAAKRQR